MGLTLQGRDFITGAIVNKDPNTGGVPISFIEGNTAIGVGDTGTAFSNAQTDLQGAVYGTNKDKKIMDGGFPSIAGNVLTFQATFGLAEANYTWNEWGVFNFVAESAPSAPSGQYMLNRKAESLGTKTNVQTWEISVELTVTAA